MIYRLESALKTVLSSFRIRARVVPDASFGEELLMDSLVSHVCGACFSQFRVQSIKGDFFIDIAVAMPSRIVGIECDGQTHVDLVADFCRDALILGANRRISRIYRVPDWAARKEMLRLLYWLARAEPYLIPIARFSTLKEIVDCIARPPIPVVRTDRDSPGVQDVITFARRNPNLSLFHLVECFRQGMIYGGKDRR